MALRARRRYGSAANHGGPLVAAGRVLGPWTNGLVAREGWTQGTHRSAKEDETFCSPNAPINRTDRPSSLPTAFGRLTSTDTSDWGPTMSTAHSAAAHDHPRRRRLTLDVWRNPLARGADRTEATLLILAIGMWLLAVPVLAAAGSVCWPDVAAAATLVILTAAGAWLALGALLGASWLIVRWRLGRRRLADWDRDWQRVEPRWSGRRP